jgi:hypothetical protein
MNPASSIVVPLVPVVGDGAERRLDELPTVIVV